MATRKAKARGPKARKVRKGGPKCWRIAGWAETYEPRDDLRRGRKSPLAFVKLLTGFADVGGREAVDIAGQLTALRARADGLELEGVLTRLLRLAGSRAEGRGWILNHRGEPADVGQIATAIAVTPERTAEALAALAALDFLECVPYAPGRRRRAAPPAAGAAAAGKAKGGGKARGKTGKAGKAGKAAGKPARARPAARPKRKAARAETGSPAARPQRCAGCAPSPAAGGRSRARCAEAPQTANRQPATAEPQNEKRLEAATTATPSATGSPATAPPAAQRATATATGTAPRAVEAAAAAAAAAAQPTEADPRPPAAAAPAAPGARSDPRAPAGLAILATPEAFGQRIALTVYDTPGKIARWCRHAAGLDPEHAGMREAQFLARESAAFAGAWAAVLELALPTAELVGLAGRLTKEAERVSRKNTQWRKTPGAGLLHAVNAIMADRVGADRWRQAQGQVALRAG